MKDLKEKINEVSVNTGRIKEYDVNVKLEHKIYSKIYDILLALSKNDKKQLEYYLSDSYMKNNNVDWKKISDEFWKNKDKSIVD